MKSASTAIIGSIILFDNPGSGGHVALPVIAIAGGLVIATIAWLAARARRRPMSTGVEAMPGASVEMISDLQGLGVERYGGELWNARTLSPLRAGQQARIVKVAGLTLWVEPQSNPKE
jgi:membrane-bound serine protease (ClpP class)